MFFNFVIFTSTITAINCFIPAELINFIISEAGSNQLIDYSRHSETIVHEEIIRRGIIASATQYLIDQSNSASKVNRANLSIYCQVYWCNVVQYFCL